MDNGSHRNLVGSCPSTCHIDLLVSYSPERAVAPDCQVTVSWDVDLRAQGPAAQAAALQRLATVLDQLEGLDLAGVHVIIGAESGIDHLGQAWLDSADTTDDWARCVPYADAMHPTMDVRGASAAYDVK